MELEEAMDRSTARRSLLGVTNVVNAPEDVTQRATDDAAIGSKSELSGAAMLPLEETMAQVQEGVQAAVGFLKDEIKEALDSVAESSATDLLRGYTNEAAGVAKEAIGRAVELPELVLEGMAQKALGEVQQFIGQAKLTDGR